MSIDKTITVFASMERRDESFSEMHVEIDESPIYCYRINIYGTVDGKYTDEDIDRLIKILRRAKRERKELME